MENIPPYFSLTLMEGAVHENHKKYTDNRSIATSWRRKGSCKIYWSWLHDMPWGNDGDPGIWRKGARSRFWKNGERS